MGEKSTGPNPTDRSKSGTKRSILVDGKGVPLSLSVDGANRHDMKMSKATLQSIVIYRPEPTIRSKQHMCLDKGYDFPEVYELLEEYGYTIHIPLRGEKRRRSSKVIPKYLHHIYHFHFCLFCQKEQDLSLFQWRFCN